jgi:hypothetical protein
VNQRTRNFFWASNYNQNVSIGDARSEIGEDVDYDQKYNCRNKKRSRGSKKQYESQMRFEKNISLVAGCKGADLNSV